MTSIDSKVRETKAEKGKGRPYIVDVVHKGEHIDRRIVWANTQAQARNHVAGSMIGCKAAEATDMASFWGKIPIEYAGDQPSTNEGEGNAQK